MNIPKTQYAVQLVGPGQLKLNMDKPVLEPKGFQILAKIEANGLCFSDLKLLKQFTSHARKSEIILGATSEMLSEIPSYVPGDKPVVPGHETVVRIVAVGDKVKKHKVGERCLVQTDYRGLKTAAGSNAAFGYNFEGGLQEYVIIDERVSQDFETGERFLIPVSDSKSASAISLVEPWACVENSYLNEERRNIKAGGRLVIVADAGREIKGLENSVNASSKLASVTSVGLSDEQNRVIESRGIHAERLKSASDLKDASYDDIIYFGSDKTVIEQLSGKLADKGIINIVLGGKKVGAPVPIGIGRIHYGMTRWIGTEGFDASASYSMIPATTEIRKNDKCLVIGAGGPMGQMHVIRNICTGIPGVSVVGTDFDDSRLEALRKIVAPLAKQNGVSCTLVNTQKEKLTERFTYVAVMAPVPAVVAGALADCAQNSLINIFAGIPAPTIHPMDIDAVISKQCYMFGTSGSVLRDMKVVLSKLESGKLDTNYSLDAVCGMAGAIEGLAAVENRTLAGKIIVYPQLHEMGLIPLSKLAEKYPSVVAKMKDGRWTLEAEVELLARAK